METSKRFPCGHCKRFVRKSFKEWDKHCPVSGWTVNPLSSNCRKGEVDTKEWHPRRPKLKRRLVQFD
jgi:hypothetical protein